MQTRVEEIAPFVVRGLQIHEGKLTDMAEQWELLANTLEDYEVEHELLYGVCMNHSDNGIDYIACVEEHIMPNELESIPVPIPRGRYLVAEIQSIQDIENSFQELFKTQEYIHRPGISFEKYIGRQLDRIELRIPIE